LARWASKVSEASLLIWKEAQVEAVVVAVEAAVVVAAEVVAVAAAEVAETAVAEEAAVVVVEVEAAVGKESIRQVDLAEARLPRKKGLPTKERGFVWLVV
jgi:hypothetical protein